MDKVFFDIELYKNYLLIMFNHDDRILYYERHDNNASGDFSNLRQLKEYLKTITLVGFNSDHYDMVILAAVLKGYDHNQLKKLSDHIIINQSPSWLTYKKFNLRQVHFDHIDIKEPAPGVMTSLKIYGGRANAPKLQDLPIEPDAIIDEFDAQELRTYCVNDLDTTEILYKSIEKQIQLREQLTEKYGVDLRSKSDAQIAEAIIRQYLDDKGVSVTKRKTKVKPFKYRVPDWVKFELPEFNEMLERVKSCTFAVNAKGSVVMPKELNKAVNFYGANYKFGIGGLHSQEKNQVIIPDENQNFGEYDIASMYPSIIIEQELYPLHLGREFLEVYSAIKDERLHAKHNGDNVKNLTYKIVLNGSYGKFGSQYSFLYSPELLIQTTITGQLFLLMAIEKATKAGGRVVSANTDGINVIVDKTDHYAVESAILDCELSAGYEFEYTPYEATYNRDVNNYIAIKSNGIKGKGAYAIGGLMKNPTNNVCVEAVISHLADGSDIETWIRNETDPTKFLTVRNVTGGAVFRGELLGKAIRFYHSTDGDVITYAKNGNKVPKSDGCKPMMNLTDLPSDIDYNWYINESLSILKDLGC